MLPFSVEYCGFFWRIYKVNNVRIIAQKRLGRNRMFSEHLWSMVEEDLSLDIRVLAHSPADAI